MNWSSSPPPVELTWLEYESVALIGNPLNDPSQRTMAVLSPPAKFRSEGRRFPVIFILAGSLGSGRTQVNHDAFRENVVDTALRLMHEGVMPPTMLALPDGFTTLGGAQYLDSPALGEYSRALIEDAIGALDDAYPTLRNGRHRAVAGKSSGGYGAIRLCMENPGVFSALAAHGPDCYFEFGYLPEIPATFRVLAAAGGVEAFVKAFWTHRRPPKDWYSAINIVAMSAAYSPRSDGGFDLPFDESTGEIDAEVWARWKSQDLVEMIPVQGDHLKSLRMIHLDAGLRDEYFLDIGARILSSRLDEAEIEHEFELFDGGHFGMNWRYETSLVKLARAIAPDDD